jgi:hypothetical protein
MRPRPCPKIIILVSLLALAACSRPGVPQAANPSTSTPTPNPTAQAPTRTPARPFATRAATNQPATLVPTATALPATSPVEPTPAEPTPPTATARAGVPAVVINGGNVRDTPVTGKVLDQVNASETVQLIQKNPAGTWYLLVTPRNVTGWVSATLLRVDPVAAKQMPVVAAAVPNTPPAAVVPSTPPASSAAPGDWTTHTIGQSTLQVPPTWQSVPLTKADIEQVAKSLDAQNPSLAQIVRQLITAGLYTQIKFFAIGTNPAGSVNLIEAPRPADIPTDALLAQLLEQLPSLLPNSKIISSDSKHQVNGLPAGRLMYDLAVNDPAGNATTTRGVQWYIVGATTIYIITVSGPPNDELITIADQIGQSFTTHDTADGAAATTQRRQIIHGGNLRQTPQAAATNIIGQVCPGDQVALLDRPISRGWVAVRITVTAPDCDAKHVPAGTEGWVNSTLLGPLPQDGSANLPPSLQITKLIPFTHAPTHISGLRPDNWTIFGTDKGFQISSSPEAPDGFIGKLIAPSDYPADGAAGASRTLLESLKQNHANGPAPEIKEDHTAADGGTLLVSVSSLAQASTQPIRMMIYARTTITPKGVLVAIALVPADLFPQEEALVRQMVDSLHDA